MASYLLLRNNKESGPYQLSDLVTHGLKPYDLVWVQGKSAAWRYPSEIEELKPYALVVEEQPYDRFFRKKEPEAKEPVSPQKQPAPEKAIEKQYEKYIPKKSVFVTLPGQKNTPAEPASAPPPAPVIIVTENPAAARVNQCNSLNDIRDKYARTLQERKSKIARKSLWLTNLKRAAVVTGLVMTGVLAGFIIRSDAGKGPPAAETAQKTASASIASPTASLPLSPAGPGNPALSYQPAPPQQQTTAYPGQNQPGPARVPPVIVQEKLLTPGNARKAPVVMPPVGNIIRDDAATKNIDINDQTGERNPKIRTPHGEQEEPVLKSRTTTTGAVSNLITVSGNDYTRVAFGGIRNLELTVTNDLPYKLEKVIVELQYLKPNQEPFKTEHIQFNDIAPNGAATRKIKDTNRGIKVLYKIVDIQPQQAGASLSAF